MIDLHSHVIYGVDDGPRSREESLQLLREAYQRGVRHIVATSHRRKGMFYSPEWMIRQNYDQLVELAKRELPGLTLSYGAECYWHSKLIEELFNDKVPTLNGTDTVLVEFSASTPWRVIEEAVGDLAGAGYLPLVAHIERYDALAFENKRVNRLIELGAYLQINASSVQAPQIFAAEKQNKRRKRARFFLDNNLVHVIASDMHNLTDRAPLMDQAWKIISKRYGHRLAESLFIHRPAELLGLKTRQKTNKY